MKPLYLITALFFISHAAPVAAIEPKNPSPFYRISHVTKELNKYEYNESGSVQSAGGKFNGGNCIDFSFEAWRLLEADGFDNLRLVTLTTNDLSHMVLLVDDRFVLSAGETGVTIKGASYLNTWDMVAGL